MHPPPLLHPLLHLLLCPSLNHLSPPPHTPSPPFLLPSLFPSPLHPSSSHLSLAEHIEGVEVATRPTVRSSILTMVNVTVRTDGGELYTGPLRLIAQHQNGTELDSNYWKNSNGSEQLHIALSNPGNSTVMFTASNGIFVQSTTSVFLVVTRGQYGAVTLMFRTADLPDNYDTPKWEMMFVNSIISYIQQVMRPE